MIKSCLPIIFGLVLFFAGLSNVRADDHQDYISQLAALDLEELLNQQITSVLKKSQPIIKAPSAISVLNAEDIRRSGATSIPELLRLVPGVTVVRRDANTWDVTARGFDSNGSAKLLVLIDGRSVYSPLYLGVFWDVQDVVMDDIERIEVIRGPGAVTWGENAVNGVINIITKKAADTQGGLIVARGGKEERALGTLQYGGKAGEDTSYRIYSKYINRDNFEAADGSNNEDNWDLFHGGFRLDSQLDAGESFTLQGDLYEGEDGQKVTAFTSYQPPFQQTIKNRVDLGGGNILARYTKDFSEISEFTAQFYYDRTERHGELFGEDRDTFDLDLQHHYKISESHDLVYGANFRISGDDVESSPEIIFTPKHKTDNLDTLFIQDEISIVPNTFSLIPGTKVGYNDYSGFEYQPALKAVWSLNPTQTLWSSVSRAVRIPARIDSDLVANAAPSVGPDGKLSIIRLSGNEDFDSEDLLAYEIGYRAEPTKTFYFDIATFYQQYDHLLSAEPGMPFIENDPPPAHNVIPLTLDNKQNGNTYGVEVSGNWRPFSTFSLIPTYSFTEVQLTRDADGLDTISANVDRRTPHHQASLRAHFNLPWDLEFDPTLYYVDSIPAFNVPAYIRTDLRLGWNPKRDLSFGFVVQNLFDASHPEYGDGVEIEKAIFGKVSYRFK